jgi:ATP-dependent helicase/nuclease subunit A
MKDNSSKILSESSYMVMAGAGAGKTTRLVKHIVENFISFKSKHGRWPRIVGTTFTKKAASEIQDRVSQMYKSYDDPEIFDFAYSSSLHIGTVHSLCLKLLKLKFHLLGFTQDLKIVGTETLIYEKRKILFSILSKDYKDLLKYYGFNSLINIFAFIERHPDVDFTPIKVEHQLEIIKDIINSRSMTFNNLLEQISESDLKENKNGPLAYEYLKGLSIALLEAKETQNLESVLNFFETHDFRKPSYKLKNPEAQLVWSEIWNFRNDIKKDLEDNFDKFYDLKTLKILESHSQTIYEIQKKYKNKIDELKKKEAQIEISDIEPLTLELLKKHKEKCQDFIKQWDYYYIDEYQDTNSVQKEIFDILLEEVCFFKVGDPQQSIYLFRGAKSSIYEQEFESAKHNENINLDFLDVNYRSDKNLLLGVNALFENIDPHNFRPMLPHVKSPENLPTNADIASSNEVSKNDFNDEKLIKLAVNLTSDQEVQLVIENIKNIIKRGESPSEICILARTKSLLYTFEAELQKHNVPSVLLVSGNYENRPEVRQCLCFLSFIENPNDDHLLFALLRSKIFSLDDLQMLEIFEKYKNEKTWSLWELLNSDAFKDFEFVVTLNSYLLNYKNFGLVEVFKSFLEQSNTLTLAKNATDLNRRHSNIYKLLTEVIAESVDQLNLSENLKSILSKKFKSQNSEAFFSSSSSGVKLMTIHGSKGLEFDHVLVVGCHKKGNLTYTEAVEVNQDGIFVAPYTDIQKNIKVSGPLLTLTKSLRVASERQETLRQIYVAATRAKKHLYFYGRSRLGDNSIYRNMKIEGLMDSNWFEIYDPNNPKAEKDEFKMRTWDFETYKNELSIYDHLEVSSSQNKLNSTLTPQQSASLKLENISVTSMVQKIAQESQKFSFEILQEQTVFKYNTGPLKYAFQKTLVGELFHKYLELFAKGLSPAQMEAHFKKTYVGDLVGLTSVIASLLKFSEPSFSEVFKNAKVEWGFNSFFKDQYLVSGQIDLWGFDSKGRLHIVDYKSGSSRFQKKAAIQLHLYKMVLQKIYPDTDIKTHVLYITEGKLTSLSTSLKLN